VPKGKKGKAVHAQVIKLDESTGVISPNFGAMIQTGKTPDGVNYIHVSAANPTLTVMLFDMVRQRLGLQTEDEKKMMEVSAWLMQQDPRLINVVFEEKGVKARFVPNAPK